MPRPVVPLWDPLARKKPKSEPQEETIDSTKPSGMTTLLEAAGVDPTVRLSAIIAPSGYFGIEGIKTLFAELDRLPSKEKAGRIKEVIALFVQSSR